MYEADQNQDAYREGLFARALGRSCRGNPYPEHSREGFLWIHGWWLIQDAREIAPADDFERGSPSFPTPFIYTEGPSTFLDGRADPPIRSVVNQTVEVVRLTVTGFLLAAAGFSLSYWLYASFCSDPTQRVVLREAPISRGSVLLRSQFQAYCRWSRALLH
jgi:hypothetical protein